MVLLTRLRELCCHGKRLPTLSRRFNPFVRQFAVVLRNFKSNPDPFAGFGCDGRVLRRVQRIELVTIAWMTVETAVALSAAWMARSPALLAFGGDSAIELLSGMVVLWRFRAHAADEQSEIKAARIAAACYSSSRFTCPRPRQ